MGMPFLRRRKSSLIDGAGGGRPRADRPPGGYLDTLACGACDRPCRACSTDRRA